MAGVRTNTRLDHDLRDEFFEEGKRLDADPETRPTSVCWLCDGRIDYNVGAGTAPDSHHLDHYFPVSTHPELQRDPDNFRHSHMLCNQQRGNGSPAPELGDMVPDWW